VGPGEYLGKQQFDYKSDIDNDGYKEDVHITEFDCLGNYFNFYIFSFGYDYKPFNSIWYIPFTWLYLGAGLNTGYYKHKQPLDKWGYKSVFNDELGDPQYNQDNYSEWSEEEAYKESDGLLAHIYICIGVHFPPIPSWPVLLSGQFRWGYNLSLGFSAYEITFAGIGVRW